MTEATIARRATRDYSNVNHNNAVILRLCNLRRSGVIIGSTTHRLYPYLNSHEQERIAAGGRVTIDLRGQRF